MNKPVVWKENPIADAINLHREQEEYILAMAASDDDDDTDEDGSSEFVKAMRPVSLDPDRNTEYESFFYPKSEGREFLVPILESLSDVTSNINLFFRFLRRLMERANQISGYDTQGQQDYVDRVFHEMMEKKRTSASVKDAVVSYLRAIRMTGGAFHNIYRSQRYTDGIDIVLNGTGKDTKTKDNEHLPDPFLGSDESRFTNGLLPNTDAANYFVEDHRRQNWQSPFGEKLIAVAKEATAFLIGSTAVSDRVMHRGISLNTQFTDMERLWQKNTGLRLPASILTNVETSNHLAEQFLQIEVMKMPSEKAVEIAESIRNPKQVYQPRYGATVDQPKSPVEGMERSAANAYIENQLNGGDTHLAPEAELLNLTLRTSLRFTLESDVAHYVSQTEANERPNLSRTNAWFSVYISQVMRAKVSGPGTNKMTGLANSRAIKMENIPRYSMGASSLKRMSDVRAQYGMAVEKTKGNTEGLFIQPDGTISARPDIEAFKKSTIAEDYEKLSEELLELLDRNDLPLAAVKGGAKANNFSHVDEHDLERIYKILDELKDFAGCVLGYDWDFGITVKADGGPGSLSTYVNIGTVTPDSMTIADYLGYDLAKEGEKPMVRNFASTMYVLNNYRAIDSIPSESEKMFGAADGRVDKFTETGVFNNIINLYFKLSYADGRVSKLDVLAKNAMRVLNYETLPTEQGHDYAPRYLDFFNADGTLTASSVDRIRTVPAAMLGSAMQQASGEQGSQLWLETYNSLKTEDRAPKSYEVADELAEHPKYFNASTSTTADFARLYTYFGGQLFKQILDAVNSIPVAEYMNERGGRAKASVGKNSYNGNEIVLDLPKLTNEQIFENVLPFTNMLGRYAPNKDAIFAEADEQVESIRPDESFSAADLEVPGLVTHDARAIFPHQEGVQSYLRKKNPPSFAIIAVDPGGGKTGQGVIDAACLVKDMLETGLVVKPLVICPNGLIKQWANDLLYFMGSNWNVIPLSASVMKRWGEKRLHEVCMSAPPNTLFVASMTFIQGRSESICIGNAVARFSSNLELIKRIGCNYIAIDESHNLKSFASARHNATKILTTSTNVKWLRILSGTIMPDRAKDIEGQIALKTPHIFRAGEIANIRPDADVAEGLVKIGTRVVGTYTPLNGARAVDRLSHYTAYIVKKRKDWAFMLPAPIEEFHAIGMADEPDPATGKDSDNTSPEELEKQRLHKQLYKLVLETTLKEMQKLLDQKVKADAADEKARAKNEDTADTTINEDNDSDFAGENIAQALWERNLARFERLIIAPEYDPAYEKVFGKGVKFVSRKAKYIVNLVHEHFNTPAWKRGEAYREYSMVSIGKDLYVAKKYHESPSYMPLPRDQLQISPDQNPDYWKKEPPGKVIIITRFNHSASAIFDALPPAYQAMTAKFTGDEPNKEKAFHEFQTDDRVKILIANEQGMSEGHNLQMASRLIRAESPWGPGALDQTNARIFRPDPKGAIAAQKGEGEMTRDIIYLDWVLANNTMEVAKQARVISKAFGIARFTEAGNPRYTEFLTNTHVPTERENAELKLSMEMLANVKGLNDAPFRGMVEAYAGLNEIESQEFREMRVTQKAELLPIQAAPNVAGAKTMDVRPFIPNMPIADPNDWGQTNVETLMRSPEYQENFDDLLRTKPVVTEWGTGRIVGFNRRGGAMSSLIVNLKNPPVGMPSRVTIQASMAYLVEKNLTPEQESRFFDVSLEQTDTAEKRQEARDRRLEKQQKIQEEQEEKAERIRKRQEDEEIRVIKKGQADGDKREKNEAEGKPLNDGIYETKDGVVPIVPKDAQVIVDGQDPTIVQVVPKGTKVAPKPVKVKPVAPAPAPVPVPEVQKDVDVWLAPAYYHGFATLEAEFTEGDVDMKALGFQWTPAYAFVTVSNKKKFHAIYNYLDENFDLSDKTVDLIQEVNSAFQPGMTNTHKLWYDLELAPVSSLPAFFSVNKRITKNRREIRVFPIFLEDQVMLCVDIRTNPAIVEHIGKAIPGSGARWGRSDGQWLYFGKNKADLKATISKVGKSGYNVVNKDEALKELAELNFRYKKTK